MRINTNVAALNSYNQLKNTQNNLSKSLSRLSSGKRINGAADDAAGLAISEKMNAQTRGLAQAQRNAQDGISMIQTAEGALKESHSILQRMRELSVQASNDTNTQADREEIQKEVNQLNSELDRISSDTEFNTKKLLEGSIQNSAEVGGTNTADITGAEITDDTLADGDYTVDISSSSVSSAIDDAGTTTVDNISVSGTDVAVDDYTLDIEENGSNFDLTLKDSDGNVVDTKVNQVLDNSAGTDSVTIGGIDFGWADNSGGGTNTVAAGTVEANVSADLTASVKNSDGDEIAAKTVTGNKSGEVEVGGLKLSFDADLVVSSGGTAYDTTVTVDNNAVSFQIGSNEGQSTKLAISDMSSEALKVDNIDLTTQEGADSAITTIDEAIKNVSAERSKLGAVQNRLDHPINNLNTAEENLTAAESRISDVDMAKEMMNMSKQQILSQAGTAMMAQANQLPQGVLQLLG
jgi:flagellin